MLTIAYNSASSVKSERLTEKQRIHNAAIEAIAMRKSKNKAKVDKTFADELQQLAQLKIRAAGRK